MTGNFTSHHFLTRYFPGLFQEMEEGFSKRTGDGKAVMSVEVREFLKELKSVFDHLVKGEIGGLMGRKGAVSEGREDTRRRVEEGMEYDGQEDADMEWGHIS